MDWDSMEFKIVSLEKKNNYLSEIRKKLRVRPATVILP
jgi:hypothetical protein